MKKIILFCLMLFTASISFASDFPYLPKDYIEITNIAPGSCPYLTFNLRINIENIVIYTSSTIYFHNSEVPIPPGYICKRIFYSPSSGTLSVELEDGWHPESDGYESYWTNK